MLLSALEVSKGKAVEVPPGVVGVRAPGVRGPGDNKRLQKRKIFALKGEIIVSSRFMYLVPPPPGVAVPLRAVSP